jgi:hypothetical protein
VASAAVGVVGVEARAERYVHEGRVLRVEPLLREQYVRRTGLADEAGIAARPIAPGQAGADRTDAQVVEQQPAELLAHRRRQVGGIETGGKGGER